MTNVSYVALSRQAALAREIDSIANNIANANTSGFRRDAFIFSEFVSAVRDAPSISQTRMGGRMIDASQGDLISTGGDFDVALEGEGYFAVETPYGQRLTRNGAFMLNDQGVLVPAGGHPVSGEGGAAIVYRSTLATCRSAPTASCPPGKGHPSPGRITAPSLSHSRPHNRTT